MFGPLDRWIEKILKKSLYKKRQAILNKAIAIFEKNHPKQDTSELRHLLEQEAHRIYKIVDRSILRERIQRAQVTFWGTAFIGVAVVALIDVITQGAFLLIPFITPLITAFVAWAISLATIPISYNQRVIGSMDAILECYEIQLAERNHQPTIIVSQADTKSIQLSLFQHKPIVDTNLNDPLSTEDVARIRQLFKSDIIHRLENIEHLASVYNSTLPAINH